ncbi:MAG TPA: methyltransferase domain-containing protein [Flavisolibacter sp.]|nr:methyltransferase domain-containing protein [Flavisolibacter sp.]
MPVNERFLWAVHLLDVKPNDSILEIGCGVGILVELLAGQAVGNIVAIDQSEKMIRAAEKRNRQYIESGKVELLPVELAKFSSQKRFSKIVAFNVNAFRKRPATEFGLVSNFLKEDGVFYLFYQLPYEADKETIYEWKAIATMNGFAVRNVFSKKMKPTSVNCLVLSPKR